MTIEQPIITLNEGQEFALNGLLQWAEGDSEDNLSAALLGSAGTGKTTLLRHFLQEFRYRYATCITAPTHKAKKVASRSTGLTAETIQSLLGIKPNTDLDDYSITDPIFEPIGNKRMVSYKLVIIDESSMLNADLFRTIMDTAAIYGTKILFVGDPLQLPPVKERYSKALNVENKFELTQVMRQEGDNPLMDILVALRQDIINDTDTAMQLLMECKEKTNERGQGYKVYMDEKEFIANLVAAFRSSSYRENAEHVRFSSWTNATVGTYNKLLKNTINPSPQYLYFGDLITTYSRSSVYSLLNSEDYIITGISDSSTDYGIKVWKVHLQATDNPNIKTTACVVNREGLEDFLHIHDTLLNKAKKFKGKHWANYYEFKEAHLLPTELKDRSGRLLVKKDIDYGYAITVHKTQGSTYDEIFVQGADINRNPKPVERRKLWYVALSRPRNFAHIIL